MARPFELGIALLATFLASCSRNEDAATVQLTPQPATLAGVYAGEWPCSNCASITATLWLRPDNAFFLRQQFRDAAPTSVASSASDTTYGYGRWEWDPVNAEALLRGAGPERRLTPRDSDHLTLRVASPLEHGLTRVEHELPFTDRITLDGESAVTDKGATFRECLTGLTFDVADGGASRELRRQHRRLNPRGKIALTTVEGHLVDEAEGATTAERLVVDRFVTMKPGTGC
jgi:hypothetical protein